MSKKAVFKHLPIRFAGDAVGHCAYLATAYSRIGADLAASGHHGLADAYREISRGYTLDLLMLRTGCDVHRASPV